VQCSHAGRRVPFFKGDGITTVNLGFCLLFSYQLVCKAGPAQGQIVKKLKRVSARVESAFGGIK